MNSSTPLRLFNVSTIARAGGIAIKTVHRRIQDLKIGPVAVLDPLGADAQPLYDATALSAITMPFLKSRNGCLTRLKTDLPLHPSRTVLPTHPKASDKAILAGIESGEISDPFNPTK